MFTNFVCLELLMFFWCSAAGVDSRWPAHTVGSHHWLLHQKLGEIVCMCVCVWGGGGVHVCVCVCVNVQYVYILCVSLSVYVYWGVCVCAYKFRWVCLKERGCMYTIYIYMNPGGVLFKDVCLVNFIYLVFTRMPGESYCRWFRPLFKKKSLLLLFFFVIHTASF